MTEAFICDAIRTPIGRYGGTLASVRPDDLGAVPLKALMARNPQVDWTAVEDIIYADVGPTEDAAKPATAVASAKPAPAKKNGKG